MQQQEYTVNREQYNAAVLYLQKNAARVNLQNNRHVKIVASLALLTMFILFIKLVVAL